MEPTKSDDEAKPRRPVDDVESEVQPEPVRVPAPEAEPVRVIRVGDGGRGRAR
jgi:hypothetical protein